MKNKKNFLIKCCISLVFFWILLSFVNKNELHHLLTNIHWGYFTLSFLLVPIMLTTSCLKWKVLLDIKGERVSFFALLRIYVIGYFFSNLLPSSIGGDVVRSFYSGQLIKNQAYAAVCVFLERFTGVLLLLLLVICTPLLNRELYSITAVYIPVYAAILLLLACLWLIVVPRPLSLLNRIARGFLHMSISLAETLSIGFIVTFAKFIGGKVEKFLQKVDRFYTELSQSLSVVKSNKLLILKLFVLTTFFYILTWLNVFISFKAFGIDTSYLGIASLTPVAMFVSHLPVSVMGNLGYLESVFAYYFLLLDITVSETLAMTLLLRVKLLCLGLVGFFVYMSYKSFRAKELEELHEYAGQK